MLIILIIITLLVIGILLLAYEDKHYDKDWAFFIGAILAFIMSIALILSGVGIAITQIDKEVTYQNKLHEKEMLEYRIDNMNEDIVGNEMLYNDIVEFNNELRNTKKWANNLFTNWFYVKDVATIDYVEIDK